MNPQINAARMLAAKALGQSGANSIPFVTGFTPSALRKWRKGLARQRLGLGNAVITCLGDSTTLGFGSLGNGVSIGMKGGSYPTRLAALLSGAGVAAGVQSTFGDSGTGANAPTNDTRFTLGSWTFSSNINSFAGQYIFAGAATATPATFTPVGNTDTCEIYYATGGTGSFNANINGGTNTLVNTAGSNGYGKVTLTGSLAANVYNVTWASGGNVFVLGWNAYNSATKQVSVQNLGRSSAVVAAIATPWATAASCLTALGTDLAVIKIGINDWLQSTSVAAFTASLNSLVQSAKTVCDVGLVSPQYSSTAPVDQTAYTAAVAAIATANGIPYVDLNGRWGGFANANADGLMVADGVHPSNYGYMDEAQVYAKLLLGV